MGSGLREVGSFLSTHSHAAVPLQRLRRVVRNTVQVSTLMRAVAIP